MGVKVESEQLRDLIDPDTEVEQVATGFTFMEGPVWNPSGEYHLVEVRRNRDFIELRDDSLVVEVSDNGCGIPAAALSDTTSLGLVGMRERIARWHGTVEIAGIAGRGTIVRLACPLGDTRSSEGRS